MIPISDDNPVRNPPFITWAILLACVAAFAWQLTHASATEAGAFVPANFFFRGRTDPSALLPAVTLITALFLHGGFLHLAGNMLYLWIFGNNVEDAVGHLRFVFFYLLCGVAATLSQAAIDPASTVPVLGASGAISGVLAGYVLIYPYAKVTVIVPLGILLYPMKVSAFYVVGFWFVMQIIAAAFSNEPGVAWWAHVGGFGMGLLLTPFLSHFPLFGRRPRGPWG